jgi:glyoxylase-like metal-dependent hydrolase (beta-lactamase superfamily II)
MTEQTQIEQYVVGSVATNCYFLIQVKTKEILIVDPGDGAEYLASVIASNGYQPVAILLTHGHFDHAGAAEPLAKTYGIPVYAYTREQETLEDGRKNLSSSFTGVGQTYHADCYVRDEQELDLAGFHLRVLFTPGHTVGGCCYYVPREDLVFSGDSLFCGSIGRTDFPGGSAAALVQSIKDKLLPLPEQTVVLPGHDARTTIGQERMYNPFLG